MIVSTRLQGAVVELSPKRHPTATHKCGGPIGTLPKKTQRSPPMKGSPSLLLAAMLSLPLLAQAAEPAQCGTVNFSDVGWTDITVTTATTSVILDALGYKTKTTMISVSDLQVTGGRQNHGRFPWQLDANDGERHQGLPRRGHC